MAKPGKHIVFHVQTQPSPDGLVVVSSTALVLDSGEDLQVRTSVSPNH